MGQVFALCPVGLPGDDSQDYWFLPLPNDAWERDEMPLDELARFWMGKEKKKEVDTVEYIQVVKANMELVREIAREKEEEEKDNQKFYYDRKTTERKFTFGDYILVFRPRKTDKLLNEWQGPFIITEQITEVTYRVDTGRKVKTFHVNAMKA